MTEREDHDLDHTERQEPTPHKWRARGAALLWAFRSASDLRPTGKPKPLNPAGPVTTGRRRSTGNCRPMLRRRSMVGPRGAAVAVAPSRDNPRSLPRTHQLCWAYGQGTRRLPATTVRRSQWQPRDAFARWTAGSSVFRIHSRRCSQYRQGRGRQERDRRSDVDTEAAGTPGRIRDARRKKPPRKSSWPGQKPRPAMVAGAGFEPATSGL